MIENVGFELLACAAAVFHKNNQPHFSIGDLIERVFDMCSTEPAITVWIFLQIVLMVFLGAMVTRERSNFGGDGTEPRFGQRELILIACLQGDFPMVFRRLYRWRYGNWNRYRCLARSP